MDFESMRREICIYTVYIMVHIVNKDFRCIYQAISGKNVCMCYESHAQSGSACYSQVLI